MITFDSGKPGGGKTKLAVMELVDELRRSKRFIVTNMAIRLDPWVDGAGVPRAGLCRAMMDKYGDNFDARDRVVLLTDEQVKRFYAVRPRMVDGFREVRTLPPEADGRFRLNHAAGDEGVCYFVDEAHEFFSARDWAKTGKEVLSWASQQRRAGDDAWFVTQVVGNVEKQLRGVSQQCVLVVNHRLQSLGFFRQPDIISARWYSSTPPSGTESPLRKEVVKYDREFIHGIYDTAAGVGVSGKGADIKQRAKGLHWSAVVFFVAGLFALVYFGAAGIRKAVGAVTQIPSAPRQITDSAPVAVPQLAAIAASAPVLPPVVPQAPSADVVRSLERLPNLKPWAVNWTSAKGEKANAAVQLSNKVILVGTTLEVVNGGLLLDGRFVSSVPTDASNDTAYVPPRPAVPLARR